MLFPLFKLPFARILAVNASSSFYNWHFQSQNLGWAFLRSCCCAGLILRLKWIQLTNLLTVLYWDCVVYIYVSDSDILYHKLRKHNWWEATTLLAVQKNDSFAWIIEDQIRENRTVYCTFLKSLNWKSKRHWAVFSDFTISRRSSRSFLKRRTGIRLQRLLSRTQ